MRVSPNDVLRFSKKTKTVFSELIPTQEIKLSQCQEIIARVFGYRNFHESQNQEDLMNNFWGSVSCEVLIETLFPGLFSGNPWKLEDLNSGDRQALSIVKLLSPILVRIRDYENGYWSAENFIKSCSLREIKNLYYSEIVSNNEKTKINFYLTSLPMLKEQEIHKTGLRSILERVMLYVPESSEIQESLFFVNRNIAEQKKSFLMSKKLRTEVESNDSILIPKYHGNIDPLFEVVSQEMEVFKKDFPDFASVPEKRGLLFVRNFLRQLMMILGVENNKNEFKSLMDSKITELTRFNCQKERPTKSIFKNKKGMWVWLPEVSQEELDHIYKWFSFSIYDDYNDYFNTPKIHFKEFFKDREKQCQELFGSSNISTIKEAGWESHLLFNSLRFIPSFDLGLWDSKEVEKITYELNVLVPISSDISLYLCGKPYEDKEEQADNKKNNSPYMDVIRNNLKNV